MNLIQGGLQAIAIQKDFLFDGEKLNEGMGWMGFEELSEKHLVITFLLCLFPALLYALIDINQRL